MNLSNGKLHVNKREEMCAVCARREIAVRLKLLSFSNVVIQTITPIGSPGTARISDCYKGWQVNLNYSDLYLQNSSNN